VFVVYRLVLGAALFLLLFKGVLQPRSGLNEEPPRPPDKSRQVTD